MFNNKRSLISTVIAASLSLGMVQAHADEGDWLLRFGAINVNPDDGSSGVVADDAVGVDDATGLFINATYMYSESVGIEILASTPLNHDITLDGVGKIAETDLLPPTVSLQYYFNADTDVRPYLGIGINYTTFFNEDEKAVVDDISLDDSVGLAIQAGIDIDINEEWFFNADIRKIDIETEAETDLGDIDVDIDPVVISVGVGLRF